MGVIQNPEVPNDTRLLVRFDVPEVLREGRVELAVLEFQATVSCPDSVGGLALDAFLVTTEWDGDTVTWEQGWDSPGGDLDRTLHAVWTAAPGDSALIRLDLTDMLAAWTSAERENCGLMAVVSPGETGSFVDEPARGGVEAAPQLTVWYTPRRGR